MSGKIMKRLFEFRIFLSAMEAESLFQRVSAAKTRPIFSDFPMAHDINRGFRQINYLKELHNQISIFLRIHLNLIMDFFINLLLIRIYSWICYVIRQFFCFESNARFFNYNLQVYKCRTDNQQIKINYVFAFRK